MSDSAIIHNWRVSRGLGVYLRAKWHWLVLALVAAVFPSGVGLSQAQGPAAAAAGVPVEAGGAETGMLPGDEVPREPGDREGDAAARAFARYGSQVAKLEVIEKGSLTKSSLGTGFFVGDSGWLITNYHVVSETISRPELYRLEYVMQGSNRPATVLAVDVIHDLAVVATSEHGHRGFELEATTPAQGVKVHSLGHPHDLGLTIVEGTYNGLLTHRLYDQMHFSGSINPGMSGGPALFAGGSVVGVNVASMGDGIGFLVPVQFAIDLLARLERDGPTAPPELPAAITKQVLDHQKVTFGKLNPDEGSQIRLGPYSLPGRIAPFLRCWAQHTEEKHLPYSRQIHQCATEDSIYLSGDLRAGSITFRHVYFASEKLNAFRFSTLIEDQLESTWSVGDGDRTEHTEFRCSEANVQGGGPVARALMCMRAYRRHAGLYDLVFKYATLDHSQRSVVSSMVANGVSYETGVTLSRKFMEAIGWHR